jgi:phosphoribosylanthranilate isomerase
LGQNGHFPKGKASYPGQTEQVGSKSQSFKDLKAEKLPASESKMKSNPIKVKVCGIRDPLESAALDAMSVDWIGFNFFLGSARYITPEAAMPLVRGLRRAIPVGVFVNADPREVIRIIEVTGIKCVQLHGQEDWDYVKSMPVPVIKAIPHTRLADLGGMPAGPLASAKQAAPLAYFLIDTQVSPGSGGFGGTGKIFDWKLLTQHPLPLPYFLAGGLGPDNLVQALSACRPFAVDLNSKVEVSPGRKDLEKVKQCLEIIQRG